MPKARADSRGIKFHVHKYVRQMTINQRELLDSKIIRYLEVVGTIEAELRFRQKVCLPPKDAHVVAKY